MHYLTRLEQAIKNNWNRPALGNYRGELFTFGEVAENIAKLHVLYEAVGLKKGDKVALCGNVHCAAMQTGTDEEVIESAEYCLKYGAEGGGYIFATSNVPFRGMPPERYMLVWDIWKKHRKY